MEIVISQKDSITDAQIQAFVDGELEWDEAQYVSRLLDQGGAPTERYEKLLWQKRLLQTLYTRKSTH